MSGYPEHPDTVIVSKKDRITEGPIYLEKDIWTYYDGVKGRMLDEFKGRNLFIKLKTDTGALFIRHPFKGGQSEFIRIDSENQFGEYNTGRILEYHVTMPAMCPYYVVDFDAVGDWKKILKVTGEVADGLGKLPEVEKTEIRYSGKRGFHVLGWLKRPVPIEKARETLKEWLRTAFGDRDDLVMGESPKGSKGALGMAAMKLNGGQVALWSLRTTGLCCVEVPRAGLDGFRKEDASLEKTYKKLTGKTFTPTEQKRAAERIAAAFSDRISAEDWPEVEKDFPVSKIEFRKSGPFYRIKKVHFAGNSYRAKDVEELTYLNQNGYFPSEQDAFAIKDTPENVSTYTVYFNTWMPLSKEDKELIGAEEVAKDEIDGLPPLKYMTRKDKSSYEIYRGHKISAVRIINAYRVLASYDRERLKPGYKGRFVIQSHHAEKAGHHFDLRLEFPVTSLQKALGTYGGKRTPETSEPMEENPDRPGTVYRSFAVRKHTLPTEETKLFVAETENHPIEYGEFSGTIGEGYGKGEVEIFDKGTYELLDVEGDKKYTMDFKGKKLNGIHTFVKYNKGYLWIKTKNVARKAVVDIDRDVIEGPVSESLIKGAVKKGKYYHPLNGIPGGMRWDFEEKPSFTTSGVGGASFGRPDIVDTVSMLFSKKGVKYEVFVEGPNDFKLWKLSGAPLEGQKNFDSIPAVEKALRGILKI